MKLLWSSLLVSVLTALAFATSPEARANDVQAMDVEVKLYLLDVEAVDTVAQNFTATITLALHWQDAELAHGGAGSITLPLRDVSYPKIQILNQRQAVSSFPETVEVFPDGEVIQRQRIWGSFAQSMDLETFPFDSQRLKISLANVVFGEGSRNLVAGKGSGISNSLTMPDWQVTGWGFDETEFPVDGESSPISGMVFSLDVKRDQSFFIYKVILPLVLIVMMSWLVFWIDPSLAASQISVAVTAMLTMIAYRFALAGMMPRLPFLTSLDHFVLASTLVVFLSMTEVIYTAHLSTNGQIEKARKIDRRARWIAPLVFAVMAMETLYLRILS